MSNGLQFDVHDRKSVSVVVKPWVKLVMLPTDLQPTPDDDRAMRLLASAATRCDEDQDLISDAHAFFDAMRSPALSSTATVVNRGAVRAVGGDIDTLIAAATRADAFGHDLEDLRDLCEAVGARVAVHAG